MLQALWWIVCSVVLYGTGFFCLTRSFSDVPWTTVPQIVGLFAFAQIAGFVALFAPAGIGVREAAFLAGLTPVVGAGPAIAITGVCRLWQTVLDLVMALIGWRMVRQPPAARSGPAAERLGGDGGTAGPARTLA
jgi:uncharacterized membrane protein YbhN (UPF0104 family)